MKSYPGMWDIFIEIKYKKYVFLFRYILERVLSLSLVISVAYK